MQLVADRVVRADATGQDRLADIQAMLRLPAVNHAAHGYLPAVERFVFKSGNEFEAYLETPRLDRLADLFGVRPPIVPAFIEVTASGQGYLIDRVGDELWLDVLQVGPRGECFHTVSMKFEWAENVECLMTPHGIHLAQFTRDGQLGVVKTAYWAFVACLFCASHRLVSVRRVKPSTANAADRALALRRAQTGRPMFSHNVVSFAWDKTSSIKSIIRETTSRGAGVRQHQRIGHWRLYPFHFEDGEIRPYWRWVDGHSVGDPSLGQKVKTRIVTVGVIGSRHGFRLPGFVGVEGQRVAAERVH